MITNAGMIDRLVRLAIGLLLLFSPLLNTPAIWSSEPVAYGSMAVGLVLIATGMFGFCPLYRLLGVQTNKS